MANITLIVTDGSTDAPYPITGGNTVTTGTITMVKGAIYNIAVTPDHFTYRSASEKPSGITTAYLRDTNKFTVTSTNNNNTSGVLVVDTSGTSDVFSNAFTATISDIDSKAYIRLSTTSSAVTGTSYPIDIRLRDTATGRYFNLYSGTVSVQAGTSVGAITGINTSGSLERGIGLNGSAISSVSGLEIYPGDVLTLSFNTDEFTWKDDLTPYPATSIKGAGSISNVKAEANRNSRDRDLLEKISLDIKHVDATSTAAGYSYIEIRFKVPFVSTKSRDFSIPIELRYGTSSSNNNTLTTTISGTIYNEEVYAYSGDRSVDISGGNGYIIDSDGTSNNVEIYFDEGLDMKTSLRRGLYYGYVDTEEDEDDDRVMNQYRNITRVYNLYTIGLNGSETTVDLNENSSYHIYNRSMEYLGTGSDMKTLPYSTKYYVSTTKLDIKDDSSSNAGTGEEPTINSPIGDTGATPGVTPPTNENYNPGTGR